MQQRVKMDERSTSAAAARESAARCARRSSRDVYTTNVRRSRPLAARRRETRSRRYVRVKRKTTTIFLNVEKSDSFGGVKQKIGEILDVARRRTRF